VDQPQRVAHAGRLDAAVLVLEGRREQRDGEQETWYCSKTAFASSSDFDFALL
jgi:hypothetical protein